MGGNLLFSLPPWAFWGWVFIKISENLTKMTFSGRKVLCGDTNEVHRWVPEGVQDPQRSLKRELHHREAKWPKSTTWSPLPSLTVVKQWNDLNPFIIIFKYHHVFISFIYSHCISFFGGSFQCLSVFFPSKKVYPNLWDGLYKCSEWVTQWMSEVGGARVPPGVAHFLPLVEPLDMAKPHMPTDGRFSRSFGSAEGTGGPRCAQISLNLFAFLCQTSLIYPCCLKKQVIHQFFPPDIVPVYPLPSSVGYKGGFNLTPEFF